MVPAHLLHLTVLPISIAFCRRWSSKSIPELLTKFVQAMTSGSLSRLQSFPLHNIYNNTNQIVEHLHSIYPVYHSTGPWSRAIQISALMFKTLPFLNHPYLQAPKAKSRLQYLHSYFSITMHSFQRARDDQKQWRNKKTFLRGPYVKYPLVG